MAYQLSWTCLAISSRSSEWTEECGSTVRRLSTAGSVMGPGRRSPCVCQDRFARPREFVIGGFVPDGKSFDSIRWPTRSKLAYLIFDCQPGGNRGGSSLLQRGQGIPGPAQSSCAIRNQDAVRRSIPRYKKHTSAGFVRCPTQRPRLSIVHSLDCGSTRRPGFVGWRCQHEKPPVHHRFTRASLARRDLVVWCEAVRAVPVKERPARG
jgi:hypothetical protein